MRPAPSRNASAWKRCAGRNSRRARPRPRSSAASARTSPLRDYLEYLPPGDPRSATALAGARLVKSRAADAVALLKEGKIDDLPDLWRLDIDPAAVCEAYGAALQAAAAKIDRTRSNYIGIAIDLERQLPNIKWLAGPLRHRRGGRVPGDEGARGFRFTAAHRLCRHTGVHPPAAMTQTSIVPRSIGTQRPPM